MEEPIDQLKVKTQPTNQDSKPPLWKSKKFLIILSGVVLVVISITTILLIKKNPSTQNQYESYNKTETVASSSSFANTKTLDWPNNIFGAYSYRDDDSVRLISEMVNSSGGDWGWILYPMNIKDRDQINWNNAFKLLKQNHLIPIIQLVLEPKTTPSDRDIEGIADFLDSLEWPTKIRFITAFNEVNAAEYWGDKIDPEDYAKSLDKLIKTFKSTSSNFFVMNGAFNASARTGKVKTNLGVQTEYLDEREFLKRMDKAVPGILKKLDGWAVHTYPQPEYKGKPLDQTIEGEAEDEKGRNTMSSYLWEVNFLKQNFNVDLPVFVTETGWPHKEGTKPRNEWLDQNTVAHYYTSLFEDLYLKDNRIMAVLPFGIKIEQLDNFSFVGKNGYRYPQFDALKSIKKTKGEPPQ